MASGYYEFQVCFENWETRAFYDPKAMGLFNGQTLFTGDKAEGRAERLAYNLNESPMATALPGGVRAYVVANYIA
jgi:hypothetical protein